MYAGIDLGSRAVKIAIYKSNGEIVLLKHDTALFYRDFCTLENGKMHIKEEKISDEPLKSIITTGYGRNRLDFENSKIISEIKAHALGAVIQTGIDNAILIDLGGQDSKVIHIENKKPVNFATNDKCAASSGKFLENMANVLHIDLEELSKHYENPVFLNNTCAVFAESELIGKIAEGVSIQSLCAGINHSICERVMPLVLQFPNHPIIFVGGVSKNFAIKKIFEDKTNREVTIPPYPEFNGSLGALSLLKC